MASLFHVCIKIVQRQRIFRIGLTINLQMSGPCELNDFLRLNTLFSLKINNYEYQYMHINLVWWLICANLQNVVFSFCRGEKTTKR
jgi:hypothetical protein